MKALYCYDVRESETYKATFKAEKTMREILSTTHIMDNESLKATAQAKIENTATQQKMNEA